MPPITLQLSVGSLGLLIALAGSTACSGESAQPSAASSSSLPAPAAGNTMATTPPVSSVCDALYDARDIPFAASTFWVSDSCPSQRTGVAPMASSTITQLSREPGQICMRGRVTSGWASLFVDFSGNNPTGTLPPTATAEPLDAAELGITQLQFTLDSPPESGLAVNLASVLVPGCYGRPDDCLVAGYYIMSEQPGVPLRIDEPGAHTLRIADFQAAPWVDPTRQLDLTRLAYVAFDIGLGDYDFCIADLKLLDDSGNLVGGKP